MVGFHSEVKYPSWPALVTRYATLMTVEDMDELTSCAWSLPAEHGHYYFDNMSDKGINFLMLVK